MSPEIISQGIQKTDFSKIRTAFVAYVLVYIGSKNTMKPMGTPEIYLRASDDASHIILCLFLLVDNYIATFRKKFKLMMTGTCMVMGGKGG